MADTAYIVLDADNGQALAVNCDAFDNLIVWND